MVKVSSEDAIHAAQNAAQSGIRELLTQQESKILTRMILAYRSGKLTPENALVGVGVISEIRLLDSTTERTIERGRRAATSL